MGPPAVGAIDQLGVVVGVQPPPKKAELPLFYPAGPPEIAQPVESRCYQTDLIRIEIGAVLGLSMAVLGGSSGLAMRSLRCEGKMKKSNKSVFSKNSNLVNVTYDLWV